jgi:phosphoribosylaminoimidazolecarboxamide formyltransferase/IMP cyclohydrolase
METPSQPNIADLPGLAELLASMPHLKAIATGKGENAGQSPMLFLASNSNDPLALSKFEQVQGEAVMGFINWTDNGRLLSTMIQAAANFHANYGKVPLLAFGGKHGNVCGGAVTYDHSSKTDILERMLEGDLLAIFGGFIIVNFEIDAARAETIIRHKMGNKRRRMIEGVIAPSFTDGAKASLRDKNGRCKLLVNPALAHLTKDSMDKTVRMVQVRGGWLAQKAPSYVPILADKNPDTFVTGHASGQQIKDMLLADAVARTSNSNTITIADRGMILANGVSQQSRIAAADLAIANAKRAGHDLNGSTAVSDSFFPFEDGIKALIDAGIIAVLASSGSDRDKEVIDLCTLTAVSLVMIPDSEFRGFSNHSGQ